jgi:dipeptidyl aminopeptidase/acylaminoacyl peptidase
MLAIPRPRFRQTGACVLAATALLASIAATAAEPAPAAAKAASPPTALWARDPGIRELKLAPDGKRLAARVHDPDGAGVIMFSLPGLAVLGVMRMERGRAIVDFHWSGNDLLVAELGSDTGPAESPARTGELISFRYDGSEPMYVLGKHRRGSDHYQPVWGTLVDPLPADPLHVLVITERYDKARSEQSLQKLNIRTGHLVEQAMAPAHGAARFVLDAKRQVRYVNVALEGEIHARGTWRREADGSWSPQTSTDGLDTIPIALGRDGETLYRYVSRKGGPWCLDRIAPAADAAESLACHDAVEVLDTIEAFDGSGEPIAAVLEPGRSEVRVFASGHPHRELLKLAVDAFPGKRVTVGSASVDGRTVLLLVQDDRSPGDWYLFDTVAKKIDYLFGRQEWLDPAWMGERRPLAIKTRDGATLQAYLTLPPGRPEKDLPLVVWPHGGPPGSRDQWVFDQDPQLLATHGYAVLQVNFRGSDGHGPAFRRQGYRAWATTMIDDLTDAVRATIASGVVDGGRVCIGGWSYGGYAALMSAVREPALYRCVIGAAGLYDLVRHRKDSDTGASWQGRRYLADAVGEDDDALRAASPITRLDSLKAPVLIVHGAEDRRTTVGQAKLLRAALEKRQHPHEVLIVDEEGHGFRNVVNVQRYYDTMLAFLARHLPPAPSAAAD